MRLAIVIVLGSWTAVAIAQPPEEPASDPEAIFDAGVRALQRQDWIAAEVLFRRALEAAPSERFRLNLAESLVGQDRLLDARVEAEAVAQGSDLLLRDAAAALVRRIDAGLARVTVRVRELDGAGAEVRLDDERVPIGEAVAVDPGTHEAVLYVDALPVARRSVEVGRGQSRELVLERELSAEAAARAAEEDPELLGGPAARARLRRRVIIGASAALVAIAVVVTAVAIARRGDDSGSGSGGLVLPFP